MSVLAHLRRAILLYVLILVAAGAWVTRHRTASWDRTLWVAVHPINGDGSAGSAAYIEGLARDEFVPMDRFMAAEAQRHGVALREPVHVVLGAQVREQPPLPPAAPGVLGIVAWSLRLRWWAWRVDRGPDPPPANVVLFVRYFDPQRAPVLAHSLGLREGLIGVVNAFASREYSGSNQVVMAHELMHTLGAADRYDPGTNQPTWPDGYADPQADPLYPQQRAALMAGRVPVSASESRIPRSLDDVVIAPAGAREIGWLAR